MRARLDHPVVDADGHITELTPVLLEYVKQIGGSDMVGRYLESPPINGLYHAQFTSTTLDERRDSWTHMHSWWGQPTKNTIDRATASIPGLLNERLEELGIDFVLLYPSEGLSAPRIPDAEVRQVACRAYNTFVSELLAPYADRMAPVATIPVDTPETAIGELEFAAGTLGMKAAVLKGYVHRQVPRIAREQPHAADLAYHFDFLGLDSDYDYDPLWATCADLKIAPTFHDAVMGKALHRSISNMVYNHVGCLAACHHALAKALFLGGVTRRFPTLRFAFLEGGVAWASALYADIIGHWRKRNIKVLDELDPANLDRELVLDLIERYGDRATQAKLGEIAEFYGKKASRPDTYDDFAAAGIERAEDVRDLFVPRFYFGCEADDPMNAMAFHREANPFGVPLRAIFGSDIGHWDVTRMNEVVAEAYEQVERGVLAEEDFRHFVFVNPVMLHAGVNPDFFKGTRIESAADQVLQIAAGAR